MANPYLNYGNDATSGPTLTAYGAGQALKVMLGQGGILPTSLYLGLIAAGTGASPVVWGGTEWQVREFQAINATQPAYAPNYARVVVPSWSAPAMGGLIVPPNSWYGRAGALIGCWSRAGADLTFPAPPLPDDYALGGTPWPSIARFGLWDAASGGNLIWILKPGAQQTRWANLGGAGTTYSNAPSHSHPLVIPALDPGGYPNLFVGFSAHGFEPLQELPGGWPPGVTPYGYGPAVPDDALFQTSPTGHSWPDAFYMGLTDALTGRASWTPPGSYYFGFYSYQTKTPWTGNGFVPRAITWSSVDTTTYIGVAFATNTNDLNWTFSGLGPTSANGDLLPLCGAIYNSATPASDDSNTLVRVPIVNDDSVGSSWGGGPVTVSGDTLKLAAGKMGVRLV